LSSAGFVILMLPVGVRIIPTYKVAGLIEPEK
jgi:hypothetical protein